jgi:hypothetical protein
MFGSSLLSHLMFSGFVLGRTGWITQSAICCVLRTQAAAAQLAVCSCEGLQAAGGAPGGCAATALSAWPADLPAVRPQQGRPAFGAHVTLVHETPADEDLFARGRKAPPGAPPHPPSTYSTSKRALSALQLEKLGLKGQAARDAVKPPTAAALDTQQESEQTFPTAERVFAVDIVLDPAT